MPCLIRMSFVTYALTRSSTVSEILAGMPQLEHLDRSRLFLRLLCFYNRQSLEVVGKYTCWIRQIRRGMKRKFMQLEARRQASSFELKRNEWRAKGKYICRHGVFLTRHVSTSKANLDTRYIVFIDGAPCCSNHDESMKEWCQTCQKVVELRDQPAQS